jgi:hypothetical protein
MKETIESAPHTPTAYEVAQGLAKGGLALGAIVTSVVIMGVVRDIMKEGTASFFHRMREEKKLQNKFNLRAYVKGDTVYYRKPKDP